MYKFRDVDNSYDQTGPVSTTRTELQTFFESYLAIASNVPMLLSMTFNSFYGRRIQQKYRMYGSLSIVFAMFFLTTVFVLIDTDQSKFNHDILSHANHNATIAIINLTNNSI